MSHSGTSRGASPGGPEGEAPAPHRAHQPRSFKLRFAAQREPGRSYLSAVRPLGLPATVTGKFYARGSAAPAPGSERALARIRRMFACGPRDLLPAPLTAAHEVGWWWREGAAAAAAARADRRRSHHLRDSPWLKARLRVLAADAR